MDLKQAEQANVAAFLEIRRPVSALYATAPSQRRWRARRAEEMLVNKYYNEIARERASEGVVAADKNSLGEG